jgi:hypothetical protein
MTRAFAGHDWAVGQFPPSARAHRIDHLFERRTPPPRLSVLEPGRQATRRRRRVPAVVLVPVAIALAGTAVFLLSSLH